MPRRNNHIQQRVNKTLFPISFGGILLRPKIAPDLMLEAISPITTQFQSALALDDTPITSRNLKREARQHRQLHALADNTMQKRLEDPAHDDMATEQPQIDGRVKNLRRESHRYPPRIGRPKLSAPLPVQNTV